MTFGEKIKNLRKSKHMNQTQLANAIGVSLRTIRGSRTGLTINGLRIP